MTRYTPQWLQAGSYPASVDRRLVAALWTPAAQGCIVTPASAMTVNVSAGVCAVPTQNGTGSTLCTSDAVEQVTLTAANGSNPRIDLVTCHPRANELDGGGNTDFIFDFVTGVPAASPVAPSTPAGQLAVAQILVPTGSAAVTAANITDIRPALLNPIAEPATTSATLLSKPDASGKLWVAKAGVNGGAWKQARDVLSCRADRNAAINLPSGGAANMGCDQIVSDPYGMYNNATGVFTAPVSGKWRMVWNLAAAMTASGQWIGAALTGAAVVQAFAQASSANVVTASIVIDQVIAAAATVTLQANCSTAGIACANIAFGISRTWFTAQYLGTG
jgi:hypothetical protein